MISDVLHIALIESIKIKINFLRRVDSLLGPVVFAHLFVLLGSFPRHFSRFATTRSEYTTLSRVSVQQGTFLMAFWAS